jgi:hypothetical protein
MKIGQERTNRIAVTLLAWTMTLSACAANPSEPSGDSVHTGAVFSVGCERSWADCYREAQRRCAGGDFEEIDRNSIETAAVDNRPARTTKSRIESTHLSATFRCK